jgi:magnesium chelatase subunit I
VGDVDPIKAASLKLPFSDERVIHFGLVPRAHRSIFVINELPDLQARIQVSLFNILQEGDLQIRGFKLRLPLDLQFVFTANPEDYTNRGSIITPLKDRIESQILTHYPRSIEIARKITEQEALIKEDLLKKINVPDDIKDMLAMIAFEARSSEYIDEKSGVSARLGITAFENLISTAERRMVINKDKNTSTRITDFWGVIPALTGKMELVYEGEQEGPYNVALSIINGVIEDKFLQILPHPEKLKEGTSDPYGTLRQWFGAGNDVQLYNDDSEKVFKKKLDDIIGLKKLAQSINPAKEDLYFTMELILHGLSELDILNKTIVDGEMNFSDPFGNMLDDLGSM